MVRISNDLKNVCKFGKNNFIYKSRYNDLGDIQCAYFE